MTKLACYMAYFTMSSVFCVPPLLFVTFREMYGISYTLLGTLVLVNFCTQLGVDLLFTLFSKHINAKWVVRLMPLMTSVGLMVYAVVPWLFPQIAYIGLVLGTVVFSVAAGISEVLLSPMIAVLPSDHPQRDMSMLHSLYAFGVVTMVLLSTAFIVLFGADKWMYLVLFLATLPVIAAVLFMLSPMPDMSHDASDTSVVGETQKRTLGLALCVACIFFGSCAENAMSNWISTYMENALGITKAVGDILGVAMFAVLLGIARVSYAKFGKNITRVLVLSMTGAMVCYLVIVVSSNMVISLIACMMTGFCTSMLWPGSLILMEEKIPHAGVAAFALMAAGGDLGASIAPQLMGIVVDTVSSSDWAGELAIAWHMSAEQIGLRAGMLVNAIFPMIGMIIILILIRHFKNNKPRHF